MLEEHSSHAEESVAARASAEAEKDAELATYSEALGTARVPTSNIRAKSVSDDICE